MTATDGENYPIAAESASGTVAARRINNTAEENVELLLTSWWEKDLDADVHNHAK